MSMLSRVLSAFGQAPPMGEGEAGNAPNGTAARHAAAQHGPLVLAYIGDTVYDLFVRTLLIHTNDSTAHGLHVLSSQHVRAAAQAAASERILPLLTQDEQAIFRRGRNAHLGTVPKNASIGEYRAATGLEAVVGYLYLAGDDARLQEVMQLALQQMHPIDQNEGGTL